MKRLVGALTLLLSSSFVVAQSGHDTHAGHSMPPMTMQQMNEQDLAALKPLKGKAFDIKFAQLMINHHQMAVNMAQYAYKNGKDTRVRANAQQVMNVQQREIDMMAGWLKAWKAAVPASLSQQITTNVPKTSSTDRWFLTDMIPHHQGAIDMAKLVPTRTQNAQLRKLAGDILKTQQAEINQYQQWLKTVK